MNILDNNMINVLKVEMLEELTAKQADYILNQKKLIQIYKELIDDYENRIKKVAEMIPTLFG